MSADPKARKLTKSEAVPKPKRLCDGACITKVDAALKAQNSSRLSDYVTGMSFVRVGKMMHIIHVVRLTTEFLPEHRPKRGVKPPFIAPTFCPFCGGATKDVQLRSQS